MTPAEELRGRRLPDTRFGDLPDDPKPGDFWKYLDRETGEVMRVDEASNLEGTCWGYFSPDGNGMGTLRMHTVREHDDGTISVLPGDGSTNSILHTGAQNTTWHGYIYHGEWRAS